MRAISPNGGYDRRISEPHRIDGAGQRKQALEEVLVADDEPAVRPGVVRASVFEAHMRRIGSFERVRSIAMFLLPLRC